MEGGGIQMDRWKDRDEGKVEGVSERPGGVRA